MIILKFFEKTLTLASSVALGPLGYLAAQTLVTSVNYVIDTVVLEKPVSDSMRVAMIDMVTGVVLNVAGEPIKAAAGNVAADTVNRLLTSVLGSGAGRQAVISGVKNLAGWAAMEAARSDADYLLTELVNDLGDFFGGQ